jgi:hypothetical protein
MKQPKKSETLEVRLSHPDKVALQKKAAREGHTVSAVIRGLIASYLAQSEPRSKPSHLTELFMTLKSKPKSVFATLACLPILATPFFLPTTANAGDISLTLESEYSEPAEGKSLDGKRVRRAKTEVHIAKGQFFSLPVSNSPSKDPNAKLYMSLRATEGDHQIVTIEITICEIVVGTHNIEHMTPVSPTNSCEGQKFIANPKISAKYGETAEFRMETEFPIRETVERAPLHEMINGEPANYHFDEGNRSVFKLTASPKKL